MFGHGRHGAAAVLLITGTMLLVGVQQMTGGAADAQTEAVVDVHNLQPLPEAKSPVVTTQMDAATLSDQFEELVKPTPVPTIAPTAVPTPEPEPIVFEKGIASTYGEGDGFEGNRTACGQIFHTSVVQIAHKSLPCGTMVRVKDVNTGRSVDAEVTDRGPYVAGRIVDLSWGAFKQLDPTGPGLLRVNVYLIDQ